MRAVSGMSWGCHFKSMMNIYHTHVMSRLLYAAPILTHINKSLLAKLSTVQTLALKVALGVPKYTPNVACSVSRNGTKTHKRYHKNESSYLLLQGTVAHRQTPSKRASDHTSIWEKNQTTVHQTMYTRNTRNKSARNKI